MLDLDALICKLQARLTADELAYVVRHLASPYYEVDGVKLGHRQTADAQRAMDGESLVAACAGHPEQLRCPACGYIGCRDCVTIEYCVTCKAPTARENGVKVRQQFYCDPCYDQHHARVA